MKKLLGNRIAHKIAITLLLGITPHVSFCVQEPPMIPAAQATRQFSQEFNLDEDHEKMLGDQLNQMTEQSQGMIAMDVARQVALVIRDTPAAPTQAGPAPSDSPTAESEEAERRRREPWRREVGREAEEKEEKESAEQAGGKAELVGGKLVGGKKVKTRTKSTPDQEAEMEIRRALIAINKRKGGKKLDPRSDLIKQMGKYIASFEPGIIQSWNIQFAPGEVSKVLEQMKPQTLSVSADGHYLLTFSSAKMIEIWDMQASPPRRVKVLDPDKFPLSGWGLEFTLSPRGNKMAIYQSSSGQTIVVVVDVQEEKELYRIETGMLLQNVNFSPDGNQLIGYERKKRYVVTYSVATGKLLQTIDCTGAIEAWEKALGLKLTGGFEYLSLDGQKLALQIYSNKILVWDLQENKEMPALTLPEKEKHFYGSVVFNQDSSRLIATTVDRNVKGSFVKNPTLTIWDLNTGKLLCTIKINAAGSDLHLVFSPDGRYLLSAYLGKVTVWNLPELERRYARSHEQAREQESKAEEENKEVAAVAPATPTSAAPAMPPAPIPTPVSASPAPQATGVSRKLTVEQAMQEFPGGRLPTKEQRTRWERELEQIAADSTDNKIDYENVWELFESIKNWGNF